MTRNMSRLNDVYTPRTSNIVPENWFPWKKIWFPWSLGDTCFPQLWNLPPRIRKAPLKIKPRNDPFFLVFPTFMNHLSPKERASQHLSAERKPWWMIPLLCRMLVTTMINQLYIGDLGWWFGILGVPLSNNPFLNIIIHQPKFFGNSCKDLEDVQNTKPGIEFNNYSKW